MPSYSYQGLKPVIGPDSFVHPTATLIGDVIIGSGCYVGANASLRGDLGRLILEDGSNLQDNCVMHSFPGEDCVIELDGHVGHAAVLHGCRVGRNALVGMGAVVMDGAVVGEESIIGALTFVKAGFKIPRRSMVFGSPARIVREVTDAEIGWKEKGTATYHRLAAFSLATMEECEPLSAAEPDRQRLELNGPTPLYKTRAG